ncbi:MAG: DUF3301 domain-containing protein [Steroidobacter sp.]
MELGWGALALICIAAAGAWFWQDSLAARENANAAATEACQRLGLQFLDGTVAFARLALTREFGSLKLRRTYIFDYTANSIERRQGFVVLTGRRVESLGYARDDEERMQQVRSAPTPVDDAKTLHIEDWRTRDPKFRVDASSPRDRPHERPDHRPRDSSGDQ